MRVLDLFSGLGGWSAPFRERGHDVFTVDNNDAFLPNLLADVMDLNATPPRNAPWWKPDIILASPPCEKFSVASIGAHWRGGRHSFQPANMETVKAIALVAKTVYLIDQLRPRFWVIENPRGVLRSLSLLGCFERRTVTYCQYGEQHMKPTDLWGGFPPTLGLKEPCKNNWGCHERAPRGAKTGTQGLSGAAERARVPYDLAMAVCLAAEQATEVSDIRKLDEYQWDNGRESKEPDSIAAAAHVLRIALRECDEEKANLKTLNDSLLEQLNKAEAALRRLLD